MASAAIIGFGWASRRDWEGAKRQPRRLSEPERPLEKNVEKRLAIARTLRRRYRRIRHLADTVPTLFWAANPNGACTFVNQEWVSFTGQSKRALLGEGWMTLVHPDEREHVRGMLAVAAQRPEGFTMLYRLRHRDGSYRWLIHSGRPRRNRRGELTGYIGSLLDITQEKQAEEALREADRRKDEFIATVAHELRNPLAPIRNSVQILCQKNAPEGMRKKAREMIDRQVSLLARLVDDLLDTSRITLGRLVLQTTEIDLKEVIDDAVEASRPLIEASQHTLSIDLPPEPVYVDADQTRLTQVFTNLLNNAAKYTPRGGHIFLAAARENDTVVVKVRDTGIGLPPDMQRRVFDMFVRVDDSPERAQSGLGIGLTLARNLIELHGGHIEAHSEGVGCGSEFVVTLPVCNRPPRAVTARGESALIPKASQDRPYRILVVDDNVDAAESLGLLLRSAGHETYLAHDGQQAVEASARLHPDVIILDIELPRLDGYEVARTIRMRGSNGRGPRIIALTGWGQDGDKHRARDVGFDEHLTKPVDPVVLTRLVAGAGAVHQPGRA
ncbi:MAG TPA: ATP-binding protein [Steroidobacteraceae bacterium]